MHIINDARCISKRIYLRNNFILLFQYWIRSRSVNSILTTIIIPFIIGCRQVCDNAYPNTIGFDCPTGLGGTWEPLDPLYIVN